jgi:hypothetical protein
MERPQQHGVEKAKHCGNAADPQREKAGKEERNARRSRESLCSVAEISHHESSHVTMMIPEKLCLTGSRDPDEVTSSADGFKAASSETRWIRNFSPNRFIARSFAVCD